MRIRDCSLQILASLLLAIAAVTASAAANDAPADQLASGAESGATRVKPFDTRFIVTGDSRGQPDPINVTILTEIKDAILAEHAVEPVDFVLFSGDLVNGATADLQAELLQWRTIMQPVYSAGIGVYPCRGNHDDASKTAWDNIFSGSYALPDNGPSTPFDEKNVTFSFPHASSVFVVGLDQYFTTPPPHKVNQVWLNDQFSANRRPHVFVFGHEPAFKVNHTDCLDDHPADRNTFWNSIAAEGGRTYFCGHDHFYDHARLDDGDGDPSDDLHQYLVGTAGAPLYPDGLYNGDCGTWTPTRVVHDKEYGYVLVEVGGGVTLTWKHRVAPGVFSSGGDVWTYNIAPPGTRYYVVLMDVTGSMQEPITPPPPSTATRRYQRAVELAKQDVDIIFTTTPTPSVAVIRFSTNVPDSVELVQAFSQNKTVVKNALDLIGAATPTGWTPLALAMSDAADLVFSVAPAGFRHLYVYTDGDENASVHNSASPVCGHCDTYLGGLDVWDPINWKDDCNPVTPSTCSNYQICMADAFKTNSIVNVRYFGQTIKQSERLSDALEDIPMAAETEVGKPFKSKASLALSDSLPYEGEWLRDIAEMSGGWFCFHPDVPLPTVTIEKTHNTVQGQHEYVSVTWEYDPVEMGGFDFLISYDRSALNFQALVEGELYDSCSWEYFTYRTWFWPSYEPHFFWAGVIRIVGMADLNDGANHPSCFIPNSLPATLFTLDFLVTENRLFECQYVPIRWFWTDCGDNTVSSVTGDTLYVSDHIYDFEGIDITDSTFGFPTYFGVQSECLVDPDGEGPKIPPIRLIDFVNGGVDIICADSIDDRGDINLNGVPNEIADAVVFTNYFIYGLSAFHVNTDGQIAATDVNADGLTLTVGDLVYLIRVIVGDALPYPKLQPVVATLAHEDRVVSVDAEMGAAYVVVKGNVAPVLLAEHMDLKYAYDAEEDVTRVLVYSMDKGDVFSGDFLGVDGKVVGIEMATYDGAPVELSLMPTEFALHQNFPNPFNPTTTITFALPTAADYRLVIYNVMGEEVTSFTGYSESGLVGVEWDASDYASGVYLYKLTVGSYTETKKMVLLK